MHRRVVLAVYYGLAVVAGVVDGLVPYHTSAAFVEAAFSVVVIIVGYFLLARDRVQAIVDDVLAGARAVTLEVLGDSAAAAVFVEQRLRAGSR